MSDYNKIMNRMKEQVTEALESMGFPDWFVICLQGSQNYELDDEESDIDSKLLVLPSLEEIVLNRKPINHVHEMRDDGSHVDCKDVRDYFKIVRKQNINFVEIFFTDYWIVNHKYEDLWFDLQRRREEIARMNIYSFLKCAKGMCLEKQHALEHEYPSKKEIIAEYGYDSKQFSHAVRVYDFAVRFVRNKEDYKSCLVPSNKEELIKLKRNNAGLSVEQAREYMQDIVDKISKFEAEENKYRKNECDKEISDYLDDILYKLVSRSIKGQIT